MWGMLCSTTSAKCTHLPHPRQLANSPFIMHHQDSPSPVAVQSSKELGMPFPVPSGSRSLIGCAGGIPVPPPYPGPVLGIESTITSSNLINCLRLHIEEITQLTPSLGSGSKYLAKSQNPGWQLNGYQTDSHLQCRHTLWGSLLLKSASPKQSDSQNRTQYFMENLSVLAAMNKWGGKGNYGLHTHWLKQTPYHQSNKIFEKHWREITLILANKCPSRNSFVCFFYKYRYRHV